MCLIWTARSFVFRLTTYIKHMLCSSKQLNLLQDSQQGRSGKSKQLMCVLIRNGQACWSRRFLHADQRGSRRLPHWSLGCVCLQILEPGRGPDWRRAVCFPATLSLCLGLRQRKKPCHAASQGRVPYNAAADLPSPFSLFLPLSLFFTALFREVI